MTSTPKNSRERPTWLVALGARQFSAQLRPKWTALRVFRGSVKEYVRAEPALPAGAPPRRLPQPGPADIVERIPRAAMPHQVSDPAAIRASLQVLAGRAQAVTLYPAGGAEPVLARLVDVDDTEPRFTLQLNDGSTLPRGGCVLVTWLDAARCQFDLAFDAPLPDAPTLVLADFPPHCLVLNRRATSRLEIPLAGNYTASFMLLGTPYELQLYDVASAGVGMRCAPRDAPGLHIGRKLQRVRLELNDTVVICDLEVRLTRRFRSFLLGEQVQIGCRFVDLSAPMQAEVERAIGKMSASRR